MVTSMDSNEDVVEMQEGEVDELVERPSYYMYL